MLSALLITLPIVSHVSLALCSIIFLTCCAESERDSTRSNNLWPSQEDGKADIYGADSRREINDPSIGDEVRERARAVAMVLNVREIFEYGDDEVRLNWKTLNTKVLSETGAPLCEDEPFAEQPAPGFCTAFLIAPDLVATSGHCVNGHSRCEQIAFVFGYAKSTPSEEVTRVPREEFYRCDSLIGRVYNPLEEPDAISSGEFWYDWAVMRLDRPVLDREPVTLMSGDYLRRGERLQTIGHPMGVAMKLAEGIVATANKERFMNTNLDIYKGNSGSPVFGALDGRVHGIVTRGSGGRSFKVTEEGCSRSKQCDRVGDPECLGNHVVRIDPLRVFTRGDLKVIERHRLITEEERASHTYSFTFDEDQPVVFATMHLNSRATQSERLRVIVHHDGERVTMMNHPVKLPYGRWTVSTERFKGHSAQGEWTIEVIDEGGGEPKVEWAQVMLGVSADLIMTQSNERSEARSEAHSEANSEAGSEASSETDSEAHQEADSE